MRDAIMKIDLHNLKEEEAMLEIDRALDYADSSTYQIQLIHGFNRGTHLKDMIMREYRHHRKVKKVQPGSNLGITVLVLRDL